MRKIARFVVVAVLLAVGSGMSVQVTRFADPPVCNPIVDKTCLPPQ